MNQVTPKTSTKPGDSQGSKIKRNLKNGFYATGIYPFNPSKAMDKIPEQDDPQLVVNDALLELLRKNCFGNNTT